MSKPSQRQAQERASLMGPVFSSAWLQASGIEQAVIVLLMENGIWKPADANGGLCFSKNAGRDKLLQSLDWAGRRIHHLALAKGAQALCLPPECAAEHLEQAHEFEQARPCWIAAARRACELHDYKVAAPQVQRALASWPWHHNAEGRIGLLREWARCASNARLFDQEQLAWNELAEYARAQSNTALRIESVRQLAACTLDLPRAMAWLKEAAELSSQLEAPHERFRQWISYADLLANRSRVQAAAAALEHAETALHEAPDPALEAELLGWQGLIAAMSGRSKEAHAAVDASLQIAIQHQLPEQTALAYRRRANISDYLGNYLRERQDHLEAIRYCRSQSVPGEQSCLSCLAYACFRLGEWKEAKEAARQVQKEAAHPMLVVIAEVVLGLIAVFRGERRAASTHLAAALPALRRENILGLEFFALWGEAQRRQQEADDAGVAEAYAEIRMLWRDSEDLHDVLPAMLWAGTFYAERGEWANLADCRDIASTALRRQAIEEARAAVQALDGEAWLGEGDVQAARQAFEEASARYRAANLPLESLWCRVRAMKCGLDGQGKATAMAEAKAMGLRPMLAILERPNGEATSSGGDLTARQKEVLECLAHGLTSKEVADRLGLSTRTIEMHVTRLLARMNCRTRSEAVRVAKERGWV